MRLHATCSDRSAHVTRTAHPSVRPGVTLLELMVTLALLAILAGVVGLSLHGNAPTRPVDARTARIAAAREEALRSGQVVTVTLADSGHTYTATAYPDGRVLADPALRIDPLTGRMRDDVSHHAR